MHTGFWCGNPKERDDSGEKGTDGRIILKWMLREVECGQHGLDSCGSEYGQVVGPCECHNHKIQPLQKHPCNRHQCTNMPGTLGTPLALHSAHTKPLLIFHLIQGILLIYYNLALCTICKTKHYIIIYISILTLYLEEVLLT